MALKPDREYNEVTDITNFWTTVAAENGGCAGVVTQGSGAAMGQNIVDEANVVGYIANPSGVIAKGILLQTVSAVMSATRDFPNFENGEIRPSDKCTLVKKGFVVTDMIPAGITPTRGAAAYLAASGYVSSTQATGAPQIGRFETTKDANGFARVSIDIT
ncbi:hypothetical protein LCGC14_0426280 [marine sediment metagenome]|uniref:Uncharacterized protein n=1 Tax=marine sediment metagenome TaxID=412755 RepID=A0A0F9SP98_9ZZZZ